MKLSLKGQGVALQRVQRLIEAAGPDSQAMRRAFHKIGMSIQAQAVMNATRQGIVDTGSLRSHIGYEFFRAGRVAGIKVGVFGVKYAALHEFGGPFTDRMRRAMFASMKRRGKMQPSSKDRRSKGVIQGGWFRARPFLIPAFEAKREMIVQVMLEAFQAAARGEA